MRKIILTTFAVLTGMFLLSASIVWAAPAPVARTGQTTCYADNNTLTSCTNPAAVGQDGDLQMGVPWPDPRFTDNGDGTVTDNMTGLMWAKDTDIEGHTVLWNDAIDFANNLELGNGSCGASYTDWRLPNRFELESLMDLGNYPSALPDGHPFEQMSSGSYWSSTTLAEDNDKAWTVFPSGGHNQTYSKTGTHRAWPVRGDTTSQESSYEGKYAAVPKTGQTTSYRTGDDGDLQKGVAWPNPRFTDHGKTVTDNLTGLIWAKNAYILPDIAQWISWYDAIDFANNFTLGNCGGPSYNGWRLPNRFEQQSLLDLSNYDPALPTGHPFSNVQIDWTYHTSTSKVGVDGAGNDWGVKMGKGEIDPTCKTCKRWVWPVRSDN